jgi:hypothetical protein
LSSEQPTRTSAAAAIPMPAVTIFFISSVPFVRSAPMASS